MGEKVISGQTEAEKVKRKKKYRAVNPVKRENMDSPLIREGLTIYCTS